MDFKYKKEIDSFKDCPQSDFVERDRKAYRLVFDPLTSKSFLPVYLLQPGRKTKECIGWGLSFFESESGMRDLMQERILSKPNYLNKIGTHIAVGEIKKDHGKSNNAQSPSTHFTHFEYDKIDLYQVFEIIGEF